MTLQTLLWPVKVRGAHMHDFRRIQKTWRCQGFDEIQKNRIFFRKMVLPEFWGPWLRSNTLNDLANTALASKGSAKTKCMITEGYRTHRGVAGPKNFKKSGRFFSENRAPGVWAPGCNLNALIELANTALAIRGRKEPIRMTLRG